MIKKWKDIMPKTVIESQNYEFVYENWPLNIKATKL